MLALAYGMRRGEVLGLHWSALDWKAGTLGVTHGVKRVKDRDVSSGRRTRLVVSELENTQVTADAISSLPSWWPSSGNTGHGRLRPRWRPGRCGRIMG